MLLYMLPFVVKIISLKRNLIVNVWCWTNVWYVCVCVEERDVESSLCCCNKLRLVYMLCKLTSFFSCVVRQEFFNAVSRSRDLVTRETTSREIAAANESLRQRNI